MSNTEIIQTFMAGFNQPEKIQQSFNLLAEDYRFKNPMVALESKAEFLNLANIIGAVLTGVNILNLAEKGDWVVARYEFTSDIPGLDKTIGTEWFRIEDGLIRESELMYDATEWRAFYEKV